MSKLQFDFVPDETAKDVRRFMLFKEAEAYQEQRREEGTIRTNGALSPTPFTYSEFAAVEMQEHDEAADTKNVDLFSYLTPKRPLNQVQ